MNDPNEIVGTGDLLDLPIDSLRPMSTRLHSVLTNPNACNFKTVRELINHTEREMRRQPYLGQKSIDELKQVLETHGLSLRDPDTKDGTLPLPFPTIHERISRIEQRLDRIERMLEPHMDTGMLREVGDMSSYTEKGK